MNGPYVLGQESVHELHVLDASLLRDHQVVVALEDQPAPAEFVEDVVREVHQQHEDVQNVLRLPLEENVVNNNDDEVDRVGHDGFEGLEESGGEQEDALDDAPQGRNANAQPGSMSVLAYSSCSLPSSAWRLEKISTWSRVSLAKNMHRMEILNARMLFWATPE